MRVKEFSVPSINNNFKCHINSKGQCKQCRYISKGAFSSGSAFSMVQKTFPDIKNRVHLIPRWIYTFEFEGNSNCYDFGLTAHTQHWKMTQNFDVTCKEMHEDFPGDKI